MDYINLILNNAFYVSLLFIIIGSLVGFYVKARSRDRCLRDFENFKVTVEQTNGKVVWGILHVYTTGLELEYAESHRDTQGHIENSYIIYNNELSGILSIYRYHDELSEEEKSRRIHDIRKVYKPRITSILARKIRNFTNKFKDAIIQSLSVALGYRAKKQPGNAVLSKQSDLKNLSEQVISASVGNAYDPILEKYIGQYVVAEQAVSNSVQEMAGILKEYTANFLELLNVQVDYDFNVPLKKTRQLRHHLIELQTDDGKVILSNKSEHPLYMISLKSSEAEKKIDAFVDAGNSIELTLTEMNDADDLTLTFSVPRKVDIILPRANTAIRHGGKRIKQTLNSLLGLDSLMSVAGVAKLHKVFVLSSNEDKK